MPHLTFRTEAALHSKLLALAKRRNQTLSDVVRETLEAGLDTQSAIARAESLALARDDVLAMREQLASMQKQLIESQRVPSFREFRARALAERWHLPDDALRATIECARLYYSQYKVWPNPAIQHRFGSPVEGFPAQPPRD